MTFLEDRMSTVLPVNAAGREATGYSNARTTSSRTSYVLEGLFALQTTVQYSTYTALSYSSMEAARAGNNRAAVRPGLQYSSTTAYVVQYCTYVNTVERGNGNTHSM